jgi:N utilization substance protein B
MSVFEILKKPEIPLKVIFDESVEISKKYCDDESSKFVNGILDRISRDSDIISHKASD